ncbi:hypothetical protein EAF04_010621 [Stromatinia cepivora]|nr:hypothetical protein EAF04_010621 [Stromatinia cepivora]
MVRSREITWCPIDYARIAQEAYPQEDPETALQKYVVEKWLHGVKFRVNGVRYVITHELASGYSVLTTTSSDAKAVAFLGSMGFLVLSVDYLLEKKYKHQSENQWNVSRDHKTHFLKFPREIQDNIFRHALLPLPGFLICPKLVTSNWAKKYLEPCHTIDATVPGLELANDKNSFLFEWPWNLAYFDSFLLSLNRRRLDDDQGPYIELRRILRPQVDATLLRTSKAFHEIGSNLLYGHNTLTFNMANEPTEIAPSWIGKNWYRLEPSKVGITEDSTSKAIRQLRRKAIITAIPGWCYYDPLIRFLYHKLRFRGTIKLHQCGRNLCDLRCPDDLILSMKCYIPFINEFCTQLQELTLELQVDWHEGHDGTGIYECQKKFDRLFKKFLENEIRELKTVRVLSAVAAAPSYGHPLVNLHIAEKTML